MNCRTARQRIRNGHDEGLPRGDAAAVQAHLRGCNDCSRVARETDLLVQWVQALPEAQPSLNFDWRLRLRLAHLERESAPRFETSPARRRPVVLGFAFSAAATAVAVVGLGFLGLRDRIDRGVAPPATEARVTQPGPSRSEVPALHWPRPVPVRSGTPLGPEDLTEAAPSILGEADSTGATAPAHTQERGAAPTSPVLSRPPRKP